MKMKWTLTTAVATKGVEVRKCSGGQVGLAVVLCDAGCVRRDSATTTAH